MIIIGLGNPGEKYKNTPHNAGFCLINLIAKERNFPDFVYSKKFNSEISESFISEKKITLVKPFTFMNLSGLVVKKIIKKTGTKKENLLIIHDDIDIGLGSIKISENRGSAGHKGVESIIKELKTKNFKRIRIGILPEKKPNNPNLYVLKPLKGEDLDIFKKSLDDAISKIDFFAS
jgi:peptidyl-tRNA hydrolase, PTH1 family